MLPNILSDDLYKLLSLNRLLRRAESVPLMQVVCKRHAFKDPINVAQALDIAMGFVGLQLLSRLVNGRASLQENASGRSDIFGVLGNHTSIELSCSLCLHERSAHHREAHENCDEPYVLQRSPIRVFSLARA